MWKSRDRGGCGIRFAIARTPEVQSRILRQHGRQVEVAGTITIYLLFFFIAFLAFFTAFFTAVATLARRFFRRACLSFAPGSTA